MVNSVVLIGMPGAGKSTVGVLLAKHLGLDFVDTDIAIQNREGKTLQQILDQSDYLNLRHIEEQVLLETDPDGKIIATGGSAAYSEQGMAKLKHSSVVVYMQASLQTLQERVKNHQTRGIAKRPEQSFEQLFEERTALYQQYADVAISCDKENPEQVVERIIRALSVNSGAKK